MNKSFVLAGAFARLICAQLGGIRLLQHCSQRPSFQPFHAFDTTEGVSFLNRVGMVKFRRSI